MTHSRRVVVRIELLNAHYAQQFDQETCVTEILYENTPGYL